MLDRNTGSVDPDAATVPTGTQRWAARGALAAAAGAVVAWLVGARGSLPMLLVGAAGLACVLAGSWWFLSNRGPRRLLAAVLVLVASASVVAYAVAQHRLGHILVVLLLAALAVAAARRAMPTTSPASVMPERDVSPAAHPALIMNPRSGGGKVVRFGLVEKAEHLGATVTLLEGPEHVDIAELAHAAVADGADLLGVAGGDGSQALVAGVAAEHDVPFLVIPAGTRNHFAMDLGLDRARPDTALDALLDGVEVRMDLGDIAGSTFVNNVAFGAYAAIVQSPAYRDDKRGTTLRMLPELLSREQDPRLVVRVDGEVLVDSPQALLVSNNPYDLTDLAGLGHRDRLDTGVLGVVAVTVDSAVQAAGLLAGQHGRGLHRTTAHEVVVEADAPLIPVGIDGEAVLLPPPVRCTIRPGVLRVRLPRQRVGTSLHVASADLSVLLHQAAPRSRAAGRSS